MLADGIRWLVAPDRSRWKPMLIGLALFAAGVGAAAFYQVPRLLEAVLLLLAMAAWFVGACGMVGYVRWLYASEVLRARQEKDETVEREKH